MIVEPRIPLKRMIELVGIISFDTAQVADWEGGKFKTPNEPYIAWMQDGAKNLGKSPKTVRTELAKDERGATVYDGIALFLKDPDILKEHYMDLPGSQVGSDYDPYLVWDGEPRLGYYWVGDQVPEFGSVSCGR